MIQVTYTDFVTVCPAAMMPDAAIFDTLQPAIDGQLAYLKNVCGEEAWSFITRDPEDVEAEKTDNWLMLRTNVVAFACASAFENAIPQLDLVLTATGFGIVSNQNVAPASTERVNALRKQLHGVASAAFDRILDELRDATDVTKLTTYYVYWHSLFWQALFMRYFGIAQPTRDDLIVNSKAIVAGTERVVNIISEAQYEVLLKEEAAHVDLPPYHQQMLHLCRQAVAAWATNDGTYRMLRDAIITLMESNPDHFEAYMQSSNYQANHFEPYANRQDDTCYFFG